MADGGASSATGATPCTSATPAGARAGWKTQRQRAQPSTLRPNLPGRDQPNLTPTELPRSTLGPNLLGRAQPNFIRVTLASGQPNRRPQSARRFQKSRFCRFLFKTPLTSFGGLLALLGAASCIPRLLLGRPQGSAESCPGYLFRLPTSWALLCLCPNASELLHCQVTTTEWAREFCRSGC